MKKRKCLFFFNIKIYVQVHFAVASQLYVYVNMELYVNVKIHVQVHFTVASQFYVNVNKKLYVFGDG